MMYCNVFDLLVKVDIETLMNISRVSFPHYINSAIFETLFGNLSNDDKEFIITLYDVIEGHYVLKQLTDEEKKKFFLIYLKIQPDNNIEKAIEHASMLIDGYLVGRYQVPLQNIPDNIRIYCANIAIAQMLIDKGVTDNEADKAIIKRHDDAIRFLENVAKGNFNLPMKTENIAYPKADFIELKSKRKMDFTGYF